ncbi:MAG: LON peptidase substrate-binding domain-containing protein [Acidimicrobiales bacterium]
MLVPSIDGRFAGVGTIAQIENRGQLRNGTPALTVRAVGRAVLGAGVVGTGDGLWIEAEPYEDDPSVADGDTVRDLARRYRTIATALLDELGGRRFAATLPDIDHPGALADTIAYWPELGDDRRVELLETLDVEAWLRLAVAWAEAALHEVEVAKAIRQEVSDNLEKDQREMLLRRQLAAIRSELGDGDADALGDYRTPRRARRTGPRRDGARRHRQGDRPARARRRAVAGVELDPHLARRGAGAPVR